MFSAVLLLVALSSGAVAQGSVRIGGYGNMHYMDHDGVPKLVGQQPLDNGFFQIREFSLFFDVAITDAIVASTEVEAGDNGTSYTANYAYLDVQATEQLSFRAGKILVPFLWYNENKPNFRQNLMSQPFTAWNLAPVNGVAVDFGGFGWSDAGVMANWTSELAQWGLLDFKVAVINGLGSNTNVLDENTTQLDGGTMTPVVRPRDGLTQNEEVNGLRDNNGDRASVIKATIRGTSFPAEIGFSWYRGKWDPDATKDLHMIGVHLTILNPLWNLKAEFATARVEQDAGIDPVAARGLMGPAMLNMSTGNYNMRAWYVEGAVAPFRWNNGHFVKLVARFDNVDTNDRVAFTPFDRSRITAGGEWQFALNTRVRFEWQRSKIHDFQNSPPPFRGAGGQEVIRMFMGSLIFSF